MVKAIFEYVNILLLRCILFSTSGWASEESSRVVPLQQVLHQCTSASVQREGLCWKLGHCGGMLQAYQEDIHTTRGMESVFLHYFVNCSSKPYNKYKGHSNEWINY